MAITLYVIDASPPVRAVRLTAKALDLDLELRRMDLMSGEHMQPWYLKLNPTHTVPTLDDNGFVVFDSHAICAYLVNKYGKNDSLYPKDPQKRAVVDQLLHFDSGTLFARFRNMLTPVIRGGAKSFAEDHKAAVVETCDFLEKLLGSNKWVAGNEMTIADFCCVATTSSIESLVPGLEKYPNTLAWIDRCKTTMVGYEEVNQAGLEILKTLIGAKLEK